MDWFNELGNYLRLFDGTPAMAFDFTTTPGLDADSYGYDIAYRMQTANETFTPYPLTGAFGGL